MFVPIIYYHSIAPKKNPQWPKNYLTLELKYFEEHLKYFSKRGYRYIFIKDMFYQQRCIPDKNSKKFVCLTFDDGYLDNFIYVYPLLKKYKAKATIFVSPEFVDKRNLIRKTLEDYWNNKASLNEIDKWGFLTWEEIRIMQNSGVIDIQSHTLTHTKYFVSDRIVNFHYPGRDCLYPIGNMFPERKPYYIGDSSFEKLIPYGYPFFEEASAVIAKKVKINDEFIKEVLYKLEKWDFTSSYNFEKIMRRIQDIYHFFQKEDGIIQFREGQEDYELRVDKELRLSKEIIEKEIEKPVEYLCWPHGDNNEFTHKKALEIGYKATTFGKRRASESNKDSFYRFGLGYYKNSLIFTKLKTYYSVNSYRKKMPWYAVFYLYNKLKYKKLPY